MVEQRSVVPLVVARFHSTSYLNIKVPLTQYGRVLVYEARGCRFKFYMGFKII